MPRLTLHNIMHLTFYLMTYTLVSLSSSAAPQAAIDLLSQPPVSMKSACNEFGLSHCALKVQAFLVQL